MICTKCSTLQRAIGLAAVLLTGSTLHAQLGVYGAFTTSKLDSANTPRLNGGTFGVQYDGKHFPLVNFGVDVRGSIVSSGDSRVTAVTAGPRIIFHLPLIPLRPYAEGLVGGAHVRSGQGFALTDSGGFAGGFAAGGDLHILPWIDWRVVDYSYTRLQAGPTYGSNISTGIVIRIPFS